MSPTSPPYSITDVATALVTVTMIGLDVALGLLGAPALDPVTKTALIGSLTVLAVAGLSAYVYNRGVKNKMAAAVSVASLGSPAPADPPPFTGGDFVITPVVNMPGRYVITPAVPAKEPPKPTA